MNYKKLFGWPVLIYAVIFLAMSGFVAYGDTSSLAAKLTSLAITVVLAFLAGRNIKAGSVMEVLKYSVVWVVVVAILDVLLTIPFTGWQYFSSWEAWAGYILLLVVPLFTVRKNGGPIVPQQP